MLRITLHITYDRRFILLLICLSLALLLSASGRFLPSDRQAAFSPALDSVSTRPGRHVYLTESSNYLPTSAISACSIGYHMASFWEIMDVSNLIYDYDHPSATTRDDSGRGMPSFLTGWVRTGYSGSSNNMTGKGNCSNWTSTNAAHYGSTVYLPSQWETSTSQADLWQFQTYACNIPNRVWCVKDTYVLYLPFTIRGE